MLDITWWQFVIGFLTVHLTAGLILGVIFQLAHVVEPTEHLEEDAAGAMKGAWMLYQMRTTNNFAREQPAAVLVRRRAELSDRASPVPAGLPRALPAAQPDRRKRLARKHGVPYHSLPTLWQAIASHYRMLKRFGDPGYVPPVRESSPSRSPARG